VSKTFVALAGIIVDFTRRTVSGLLRPDGSITAPNGTLMVS